MELACHAQRVLLFSTTDMNHQPVPDKLELTRLIRRLMASNARFVLCQTLLSPARLVGDRNPY